MESELLITSVYLATMVVAVPISARLGLGSVLGYLMAGILIGPVLGLAGSAGDVADLQHFAEFGVVMMLFLIGLELEPRQLWAMRRRLIGLGGMQIAGTTVALFVLGLVLHQSWQVALTLGLILSLSSTAIVLQTLSEKSLMQTGGGRGAFAVLLTQDIAVIPILAALPLLGDAAAAGGAGHGGPGSQFMASLPGWAAALVTLGAVGLVIVLGQFAFRPIFRFVQSARLQEMNTAVALLIVVGIATLMTMVGLSPALGTFLAGVMLAGSEFRHELESQVAPFKGLLLGLFFITVGAGMNFGMLFDRPVVVTGVTALVIAIKAAVLFAAARAAKMSRRDRMLFTLSLAQAGEFGFVLLSYATGLNILDERLAQGFLLVIALSMLATPLLFILYDRAAAWLGEDRPARVPDRIDDQQAVIIAGVGRFGQVVNRLVSNSGFKTVVLDNDLDTIQLMRRFGGKGYFGDPTRPQILAAAGLDKARVLVAALGEREANLALVRHAREQRPDLVIVARARDRVNVYELYEAGADHIVRELFDSSLRAGRYVLENLGLSQYEAHELERIFYRHDRAGLRELADLWRPGVPLDQNPPYIRRAGELRAKLETALMERFAGTIDEEMHEEDDEAPEHGLSVIGREDAA